MNQSSEILTQDSSPSEVGKVISIESIKLPAEQPRRYFDPQKLQSLVQSIKEQGILEPLLVRPLSENEYELVAGERRFKAAQELGLKEVPVVIRNLTDAEAVQVALVENLQREDLNPIEETEGVLQYLALKENIQIEEVISQFYRRYNNLKGNRKANNPNDRVTQFEENVDYLFNTLGQMKWDSFVKNRLPLLNLPDDILEYLRAGMIEYTKAKAIAKVNDPEKREIILTEAIEQNLSLSKIKKLIAKHEPKEGKNPLEAKIKNTLTRVQKARLWEDPLKQEKIEKLLEELELLLEEEVTEPPFNSEN